MTEIAAPGRRRGRPPGARTRVLRQGQALGVQHFAFLRACLQCLPLKPAWDRYLAYADGAADQRLIERRRDELLARVLHDGHQINLTLPATQQITHELALLARGPQGPTSAALPTLSDFADAQGLDPDAYSEAELIQEYQAFYGLDGVAEAEGHTAASDQDQRAQLRALARVEALLARPMRPEDRLDMWLAATTLQRLKAVGLGTLAALAALMAKHGARWYRQVPGLGVTRAAALQAWLTPLAETWAAKSGTGISTGASSDPPPTGWQLPVPAAAPGGPVWRQAAGSAPAAAPPPALPGLASLAHATDDQAAMLAWLALQPGQPSTHRAYRIELERFLLWCQRERRLPLAALGPADGQAYRQFLAQLPPAWVQAGRVGRHDARWRPFRGALSPASQRRALAAVQGWCDALCAAGYLARHPLRAPTGHAAVLGRATLTPAEGLAGAVHTAPMSSAPMSSVPRPSVLPPAVRPPAPRRRSLTAAQWPWVEQQLRHEEDRLALDGGLAAPASTRPAQARRLRWVLAVLSRTGLRLGELAGLTAANWAPVPPRSGSGEEAWLQVTSPGGAQRRLPVPADTVALWWAHLADAASAGPLPAAVPLVCSLRPQGMARGGARHPLNRALSAGALYRVLKRFFMRCALRAQAGGDVESAGRLRLASTHWLRHGFGLEAVAGGMGLPALQAALGHASAASTSAYLDRA